jgi:uncharacterized membrane protein
MRRIEQAIAASESRHRGELRFVVESALPVSGIWRNQSARERAIEIFADLRVWDTEENSGVLVYLLFAERDVEIVADRGIHSRCGAAFWDDVCRAMEQGFAAGEFVATAEAGIRRIGAEIEKHFPATGNDLNELPDAPVQL